MPATSSNVLTSPSLTRIARGNLCSGCGACGGLFPDKISLGMAPPGFLRPRQIASVTAEEDARIARICPGIGQRVVAEGRADHVLWGPYVEMLTGWAS